MLDASGDSGKSNVTAGKPVSALREGAAGGDIRIGGDYLGQGDTPTALNLYVDSGVLVMNDALTTGDAGRSIFWADGTTQFYGNVYARAIGGHPIDPLTGNVMRDGFIPHGYGAGGFVETSGHVNLDADGYVNLSSASGEMGTYFLDPANITIYGNVSPTFVSTDSSINLAPNLRMWLDASDTSQVTLTYSNNAVATTASGTIGTNTITTAANVSTALAPGARIRIGGAGATTTAVTMGADTYTIASVAGTTITTVEPLTATYALGTSFFRGLVSGLGDKSGQGNNAAQATASRMPLWVSNGMNGLGTASFDGAVGGDLMAITLAIPADFTFFSADVKRQQTTDAGSAIRPIFSTVEPGTGLQFGVFRDNFAPNSALTASWYGGSAGNNTGAGTWALNAAHIAYVYMNNGGGANNVTLGLSGTSSTFTQTVTALPATSYIGGENTVGARRFNGNISDAIMYNGALGTDSRAIVDQYESAKWGIALTPPGTGATEVAKATAADGYSVFTTRYLERLAQSANVSLQATNNITLDLKGDTLNIGTAARSLTLTAGNQITAASAGNITTNGGDITLNAPGGVNLAANTVLNAGTGSIILNNRVTAATGDMTFVGARFVNNAGASALSAPAGRWLVYTTDPGNNAEGGIVSNFLRFSCAYGGSCPALGTGNGFLYSNPQPVSGGGGGSSGGTGGTGGTTPDIVTPPSPTPAPEVEVPSPLPPVIPVPPVVGTPAAPPVSSPAIDLHDLPRINNTAPIKVIAHTRIGAASAKSESQSPHHAPEALISEGAKVPSISGELLTYTSDLLTLLDCPEQSGDMSCKALRK